MKSSLKKYLIALLLFGSNGIVASFIGLTSYEIVFMRSFFGCILLLALFKLSKHKMTAFHHKRDLLFIALSGVAMGADWLFLYEAFTYIGVSLGMLINYFGPVIVVALSPIIFKERLTLHKVFALFLAIAGVLLISGQIGGDSTALIGLFFAILSAFSYVGIVIFNKLSKNVSGFENATIQLFFTLLTVSIYMWFKQGFQIQVITADWLPILWLGLVNTGIGCYLYFSSIGKLPVQTVAICGYLEPLSAVLFSVIVLKESLEPIQLLGAGLIIGGALLGEGVFGKGMKTGKSGRSVVLSGN